MATPPVTPKETFLLLDDAAKFSNKTISHIAPTDDLLGSETLTVPELRREKEPCAFLDIFTRLAKKGTGFADFPFLKCNLHPGGPVLQYQLKERVQSFPITSVNISRLFSNTAAVCSAELSFASQGKKYSVLARRDEASLSESIGINITGAGTKDIWRTMEITLLGKKV